ncbi:hypothetical protein TPHA_0E03810 [Tetrapisispora phaffii CBS 4417]|uniref:ER membrane protein complex subunit 1 n=1 Tax=Tetrapisispora phaffii (strain ATCC 24235 / CBS 4417 / NBRC 1672 / NRRL Y-8282 / UCD 70-5) TaxID=1071381 RepID=G8BU92_TETPH|nr:hypothetical protein TPHA_0E03810 [Tetrapisispora phaffii CBS 4417]CCE63470.1 hypothetical protein TPHA_0E03810 [Tetrapisispora phaffii CBS 4417]
MSMKLFVSSVLVLINAICVQCVYMDEAYLTDWHLANIGEYRCVFDSQKKDKLIILSEIDEGTVITYLNKTDGTPTVRQKLSSVVDDVLRYGDNDIYFKSGNDYIKFNDEAGLDYDVVTKNLTSLNSICSPNSQNIKMDKNNIRVIDTDSNLELMNVKLPNNFTSFVYATTDGIENLSVLFTTGELKYMFQNYKNGNITESWERNESLTDIVAHAYVTLPDLELLQTSDEILAEYTLSNPIFAYLHRIKNNINRIISFIRMNRLSPGTILTNILFSDTVDGSETIKTKQNFKFGFSKLLIVGTKRGQISALDILNGKPLWNLHPLDKKIVSIEWNSSSKEFIVVYETGQYFAYKLTDFYAPIQSFNGSLKSQVRSINLLDDSSTLYVNYKSGDKEIVSLSKSDDLLQNKVIFITDHNERGLSGHMQNSTDKIMNTWKIDIPKNEKLVAYAKRIDEPIANIGVVTGNRTVLYKYLYPNLVSYAVVDKETKSLYIDIVDSVTGSVLYTQKHDDSVNDKLPINMVFGEHWIVYSYFSSNPIPEQKLVVIELYDSLSLDVRVSDPNKTYNPLDGIYKPKVITKSYFFPEIIKSLQLSKTKFNIASKAILIETQDGQMSYIPKYIVGARRKEEKLMTDDDKKEFMAAPYNSNIPSNDHFVITHSRQLLMGNESIISSVATNLESTSIVCNLGHDIFCTKIYPSSQFDIMNPTFEKGKLLLTIVIMSLVLFFIRPRMTIKQLKTKWMVRD